MIISIMLTRGVERLVVTRHTKGTTLRTMIHPCIRVIHNPHMGMIRMRPMPTQRANNERATGTIMVQGRLYRTFIFISGCFLLSFVSSRTSLLVA